jgi:hypothetical protein
MVRFLRRRRKNQRGFLEAQDHFQAHGLPFPYIPQEMRGDLRRLNQWMFGAGHNGRGLLDIHDFKADALARPDRAYVLLGQAGYGINSYAMHFYLARNPLYLFLQIAYGGVYTDSDEAIESMKLRYDLAEWLIKNLPGAVRRGAFGPDERWVIVESDFYGSSWVRQNCVDPKDEGPQELEEYRSTLEQVIERLESLN